MNALDRDALLSEITVNDLRSYLSGATWQEVQDVSKYVSLWTHKEIQTEIFVPKTAQVRDFDRQLSLIVTFLAELEEREPRQIITDMKFAEFDVVRVHVDTSPVERGTIGLEKAASVLEESKSLLSVAARAAIRPNSFYVSRLTTEASDYLATTRFGQTEPGSFTFTILSPVPSPRNNAAEQTATIPYARRVTQTLAKALTGIRAAATFSTRSINAVFDDLVDDGVSANMCDSLATIADQSFDKAVEVSFTWSGRVPEVQPRSKIIIPATITSILPDVSKHLKAVEPVPEYQILGYVDRLINQDAAQGFDLVLKAVIEGRERLVILELADDQRAVASTAWTTKKTVFALGTLDKRTRPYTLLQPTRFEIVDV
jgi:hypothetical protein